MYIANNLEFYKLEYEILQTKYKKLMEENRYLKNDLSLATSREDMWKSLFDLAIDCHDRSLMKKALDAMRLKNTLEKISGI